MNKNVKLLIATSSVMASLAPFFWTRLPEAVSQPRGERKEHSTERNFVEQTEVEIRPVASVTAAGWDSERVWSGQDDWEPFVAADPSSDYVYQLTTRFGPHLSGIAFRRSANNGAT